jgi:diadenosine tetraphosphate (Ap4A) HIT family hydrolase
MTFALHERLSADTIALGDLHLCRVLLMNDARFPWLILVPRRKDLVEILDLAPDERTLLMTEISAVSAALKEVTSAHKLNVAALGNMVAQLHIHIIARFTDDTAWPAPVWGSGNTKPYDRDDAQAFIADISRRLGFA